MTRLCRHCKHAEGRASMLAGKVIVWCALHRTVPVRVCGDWEREPGADDDAV